MWWMGRMLGGFFSYHWTQMVSQFILYLGLIICQSDVGNSLQSIWKYNRLWDLSAILQLLRQRVNKSSCHKWCCCANVTLPPPVNDSMLSDHRARCRMPTCLPWAQCVYVSVTSKKNAYSFVTVHFPANLRRDLKRLRSRRIFLTHKET